MRPKATNDRVTTSLRIERELLAALQAAAAERQVAVNWLMSRLLAEGLDHLVPPGEMTLTRRGGAT